MYPESYSILRRCEYSIKPWKKAIYLLLGVPLIAGGFFLTAISGFGSNSIVSAISSLFFLGGGVYALAWAFRSKLAIDGTRIDVRTAFGDRTAELQDIEGYRTISTRYGSVKRLQLKNGDRAITVSNDFETDGEFSEWMRKLPDLDDRDRASLLDEIKEQRDLGATPEERLGKLANAKSIGIFAIVVAVALALAVSFGEPLLQLPAGLLLAAAPAIVFLMIQRSPLLYTIFKRKADPRADLAFVLMAASLGFLFADRNIHLVSMQSLLPEMLLLAALYLAPLWISRQDNTPLINRVISLLIFAGIYSYGVAVSADSFLDTRPPAPFRATVLQKRVFHGRSTSYALYLAPWGPIPTTNRLNVTSNFYDRTQIGDSVCLDLHPGSLHAQWFMQVDCAMQSSETAPAP